MPSQSLRPAAQTIRKCALLLLFFTPAPTLHAQGCTQCLDSTRATPPQVQAAYRHAIYLLGGAGTAIFLTGTLLLRKKL